MGIKVPGDPFSVGVQTGSTEGVGLYEAPDTSYSARSAMAGLEHKASEFGKQLEVWQAEIDTTRVNDWANQLEAARMDLRDNPNTGYKTLKGDNALAPEDGVSLLDKYGGQFEARYQDFRKKAANPRQKAMLDEVYRGMKSKNDAEMQRYLLGEFETKRAAVEQETMRLAVNKAVSSDPSEASEGEFVVRKKLIEFEKRSGAPIDKTKVLGQIHSVRIDRFIGDGDVEGARAYLNGHRDEMLTGVIARAEESIARGEIDAKVEESYQRIVAAHPDDRAAGMAEARQFPAKIRRRIEAELSNHYSERDRIEREERGRQKDAAWDYFYREGRIPPASYLEGLDAKTIHSIEKEYYSSVEKEAKEAERIEAFRRKSPIEAAQADGDTFGVGSIANWGDGAAYETLETRAKRMPGLNAKWGVKTPVMLSSAELESLKGTLSNADPASQAAVMNRLAQSVHDVRSDEFDATAVLANQLGDRGVQFLLSADENARAGDAPRLYAMGRMALKEGRPEVANATNATTGTPAYASKLDGLFDDPRSREATLDAIGNVAAGLAIESGSYLSSTHFKKAMQIVVGDVVEWNGRKVALRDGADLSSLETAVRRARKSFSDVDGVVAKLPNGQKMTGKELAPYLSTATLRMSRTGDDNTFEVILGSTPLLNPDGSPFELVVYDE